MKNNLGRVRYDRYIGWDITKADYLGKLHAIIGSIRNLRPNIKSSEYAFDIHLREKSKIMVYHGGTCLLTIKTGYLEKQGRISFVSASYKNGKNCSDEFELLSKITDLNDLPLAISRITAFLLKAVGDVEEKWFSKEAFFASKLSIDYGINWRPGMDWLIIDREAVLGFDSQKPKDEYYEQCRKPTDNIAARLKAHDVKSWGKNNKSFGDEVDFLAIGPKGQLICIELKHESFVSGIYWSPIQASVYREAFRGAVSAISDSIIQLVKQKVALGLLPVEALQRLPEKFTSVESVVFIVCSQRKGKGWEKLATVRNMLPEPIDVYVSDCVGEQPKFTLLEFI